MSVNKNYIISFLNDLSENNHKVWFEANKDRYLKAKQEMEDLVQEVIEKISVFDPSVADQMSKKCVYRIYRDVRFSKNKVPYKNNMGGFIVPGGKKSGKAGYYLHLEPGNSFLAGGVYMPESANLKKIRDEILYNTKAFKSVIESDEFVQTFGQVEGEKLKRPPKGFPADFTDVELLKFKSYTVLHRVSDLEVNKSGFVNQVIEVFKAMKGFNDFLNQAMD